MIVRISGVSCPFGLKFYIQVRTLCPHLYIKIQFKRPRDTGDTNDQMFSPPSLSLYISLFPSLIKCRLNGRELKWTRDTGDMECARMDPTFLKHTKFWRIGLLQKANTPKPGCFSTEDLDLPLNGRSRSSAENQPWFRRAGLLLKKADMRSHVRFAGSDTFGIPAGL